jgi:hypothetical protein
MWLSHGSAHAVLRPWAVTKCTWRSHCSASAMLRPRAVPTCMWLSHGSEPAALRPWAGAHEHVAVMWQCTFGDVFLGCCQRACACHMAVQLLRCTPGLLLTCMSLLRGSAPVALYRWVAHACACHMAVQPPCCTHGPFMWFSHERHLLRCASEPLPCRCACACQLGACFLTSTGTLL